MSKNSGSNSVELSANQLSKSFRFIKLVLDHLPNHVFWKDCKLEYIGCNKAFADVVGLNSAKDVVGKTDFDFARDDRMAEDYRADDRKIIDTGIPIINKAESFDTADGKTGVVLTTKIPIYDDLGNVAGLLGICDDVTNQKQTENKLIASEERWKSLIFNIAHGIVENDTSGTITFCNRAFHTLLDYPEDQLVGKKIWEFLVTDKDRRKVKIAFKLMQREKIRPKPIIFLASRNNGSQIWLQADWAYRKDVNGHLLGLTSIISDVTYLKRSQIKMDYLAHHDILTGLPNRLLLFEQLAKSIKRAEKLDSQLAVLVIDIDNFKNINDSFGHNEGDVLLKDIAERIKGIVRSRDGFARIGGDEFVLLVEDLVTIDNVIDICEKLMGALKQPAQLTHHAVTVTASIGVSLYPQDGTIVQEILRNADTAMYQAKSKGRNNYQFYTKKLTEKALRRVFIENNLRNAIANEELEIHYQPQVNLGTGEISGVEALLRWQSNALGNVPPSDFIPIAEESGLIVQIGAWVLSKACCQMKEWLCCGLNIEHISVNVSGIQIQKESFFRVLEKTLKETMLPPSKLELEVTENVLMAQAKASKTLFAKLKSLGVKVAIDDFGTGYSSLSYLKQLPIDKIKIDQSFVKDVHKDASDVAIITAIVVMSKSLGLKTIAEGIETKVQQDILVDIGCIEGQGYYYSKPLSQENVNEFLSSRQKLAK